MLLLTIQKLSFGNDLLSLLDAVVPFIILLLLHNYCVIPLLKKKRVYYILGLVLLLAVFAVFCFSTGNPPPEHPRPVDAFGAAPPPPRGKTHPPIKPEWLKFFMGMLVIGVNWAWKYSRELRKREEDNKRLREENLKMQLESLRRQINPHFFLNTLNNIQALVLTEPEKAAESIRELSHIMQLALYEGDAELLPLTDEIAFLQDYISLMRLRYTDAVDIRFSFPSDPGEAVIQPLIIATFLENAFKYGVSYGRPSYVDISISLEHGRLVCRCSNSVHPKRDRNGSGIGLSNIRRRLDLVYGDNYSLDIKENDESFEVELDVPSSIATPEV